jgi:threonine dehydratase
MPTLEEPSIEPAMANGTMNGVNGDHRPQTPVANGMSLTEYSMNPTTPSEEKRARIRKVVPDDFLQEDGYPDVSRAV